MKADKDIMIDSLMARIRELEADKSKQQKTIEKLNIKDYLLGQFVFTNRADLLNSFAKFVEDSYEECACSHGYENIEPQVLDILDDLADGIDMRDNHKYADLLVVINSLQDKI